MASSLTAIERTRGFLEGAQLSEKWLSQMQAQALVLEAHHTTHIEGTHLNLDQSKRLMAGERVAGVDTEDVKELLNYRKAFDFVAEYVLSKGAITEGLIREIHKRLVDEVRGNHARPGQYRTIQNYVANSHTKEVIYTPPPAYEVPLLMAELVDWIQTEERIPPILKAGIAQFQLVHIHPFLDGNGRTARLLSTLMLYRSGYDFKRLFTISEYYDRNRPDYYFAIQNVRNNDMDMTGWLEYFTKGLESQMREMQEKCTREMKFEVVLSTFDLSEKEREILEKLREKKEEFSIQEVQMLCPHIPRRSLQRDLARLVEKGIFAQRGERKARRYRLTHHFS